MYPFCKKKVKYILDKRITSTVLSAIFIFVADFINLVINCIDIYYGKCLLARAPGCYQIYYSQLTVRTFGTFICHFSVCLCVYGNILFLL